MEALDFQRLLFEYIETDDSYPNKKRLLELLSRSNLSCEKTGEFTHRKWDHFKENIYIIVEPADREEMEEHKDYIARVLHKVYPIDDSYSYELFDVIVKPGKVKPNELTSQEVHFENIERQILHELETARYTIWVAMAWFTSETLFNALVQKKKEGVNIQIIIDNNAINQGTIFSLDEEFETYRLDIWSRYKNVMHDKFCVIDFQTVIHGTFNWTKAANYNKETISIDKNSSTAYKFADEFMNLKRRALENP